MTKNLFVFSWLKKLFNSTPPLRPSFGQALQWIEASDNPWGVRILDCRPVSMAWTSTTKAPDIAASFVKLRTADGRAHLKAEPLPVKVSGELTMPEINMPPEGCFSLARQMEEKWDLFHFDHRLFVSRSWTGVLGYTASLHSDGTALHVSDIRSSQPFENQHLLRELHFILNAHGLRQIMPHPLPAHLSPEDSIDSKEQIALHTFSWYGALGWFGTFEDTIPLPEVPRAELKKWMDRQSVIRNPAHR